jgi:hypothetical protein
MKEEQQHHQQHQQLLRADASVLDSSVARILPPSQEISPTKSSLRLMRQISGLGMEDPVFGLAFFDDHRGDTSNSDSNNHNNNSSSNSDNHHNQKMVQRRGSMLPLPMMDLLFQDMGFEDLPRDMRDAMSVASDPTAAYCPEQADKMLMRLRGRGGHNNNNKNNNKKKKYHSNTNKLLLLPSTPETSTNNSYSHAEEEQQQQQQQQPVVPHDDEDTTTYTMTKDTLLAEAAQALEGRVSSDLLAAARHQIYGNNRNGPKASRRASLQHCHGGGAANNIHNNFIHKPTTVPAPWKLQPIVSHHSSLTTLDQHRHHRVLPSLEHIFPV